MDFSKVTCPISFFGESKRSMHPLFERDLYQMKPTVFGWRHANLLFEYVAKIKQVFISATHGDLGYGVGGFGEQALGLLQA